MHGAAHRVRKAISRRALGEVACDHVPAAPLREQAGEIEVKRQLLQPLVIMGVQPARRALASGQGNGCGIGQLWPFASVNHYTFGVAHSSPSARRWRWGLYVEAVVP